MEIFRQSEISDSFEAMTLEPKIEEFRNFPKYIQSVEAKNLSFVKVSKITT